MKAFITYVEKGRVSSVGIPSPEFGDRVMVEAAEGEAVVAVDVGDVVKGAARLTFATAGEAAKPLLDVVRTIAEQYRVDPATRRLVAKEH